MDQEECQLCGRKGNLDIVNGKLYCTDQEYKGYRHDKKGCSCSLYYWNDMGMTCYNVASGCIKCGLTADKCRFNCNYISEKFVKTDEGHCCKKCNIINNPNDYCIICGEDSDEEVREYGGICSYCDDFLKYEEDNILRYFETDEEHEKYERIRSCEGNEIFDRRFSLSRGYINDEI